MRPPSEEAPAAGGRQGLGQGSAEELDLSSDSTTRTVVAPHSRPVEPAADYDGVTEDEIVVHEQAQIAVYRNARGIFGEVVIRQKGEFREEDHYVLIAPEHVPAVAAALLQCAGFDSPSRQSTGAQRQKRYRDRQRDRGVTDQR